MYDVDMEVETEWVCLVISLYHWMGSQNEINPRPKYGENGEVHLARSRRPFSRCMDRTGVLLPFHCKA